MHILLVADGRSPITRRWIEAVRALDHRITLVSTFPCDTPPDVDERITLPVAFSQMASRQGQSSAPAKPASLSRRLHLFPSSSALLLKTRYLLGPITVRAAVGRFRHIVDQKQPDLVHALRIPFEGMLASSTPPGIPLAVSIWGNDLTLHAPASPGMVRLTHRTLQRADGLLTDVVRDQRLARQWGYPSQRPAEVVPGNGGIDLQVIRRERAPLPAELEALLPVGLPIAVNPRGIRAYTRTDTFFQSIPLTQEQRPQICFACPAMQSHALAHSWMQRLKLDQRTVLLPGLSQGQLWTLFERAFASLSITTHDGTPNTLLEAMACGSFPIAGDIESLREWITPGVNGLLVDPGDPAELAGAVVQALDRPELRAKAAEKNLAIINERAEISVVRPRIDHFYRSLILR